MPPVTDSGPSSSGATSNENETSRICEVWASNLEDEFKVIRQIVQIYDHISMDTEFPGTVVKPVGEFRNTGHYQYHLLKCNVNMLKMIQLGLTFQNEKGQYPPGYSTWQFNFKFSLKTDTYAQDSIDMLIESGIQFEKHEKDGIEPFDFAELLMSSGVVLMPNVKMISFHSGYDFGYLLKMIRNENLPEDESEFFDFLKMFFPNIYDVKYLMKSCKFLRGGLQEVANQVDLRRIGRQHQAGSDSHLTGAIFFKVREMFFEDAIDDVKYSGLIHGPLLTMNLFDEGAPPNPPPSFNGGG